jgi:DNA-binding transcriptional regulator YiaG
VFFRSEERTFFEYGFGGLEIKKYNSEACEVIYEEVMAEFEAGLISEAEMREYNELCLVQEPEIAHKTEKSMTIEHATA